MRNILLSLSCFLCFNASLKAFEGFYAGVSTGPSMMVSQLSGQASGATSIQLNADLENDAIETAWEGNFFVGYGKAWGNIFAGLEAFARYSPNNFSITTTNRFNLVTATNLIFDAKNNVEVGPWHGGIDFRPGFFFNYNTLLYGRIGVEWTEIEFSTNLQYSNVGTTLPFAFSFTDSESRHNAFLRLGAGIEKQVWNNITFRLDYIFTNYRKFSFARDFLIPATAELIADAQADMDNHSLVFGLSYYFSQCRPDYYCDPYDGCDPCLPHFDGFYLAASGGGALLDAQPTSSGAGSVVTVTPAATRVNPISFASHLEDSGFLGTLYAGFGRQWSNLYAGLEVFGQYSHLKASRTDSALLMQGISIRNAIVNTTVEVEPWQWGLDFRPGFTWTPSMLVFGTIGTSCAKISASMDANATYTSPAGSASASLSKTFSTLTLRAGGGIEYAISPRWHLRADYLFTDYGTTQMNLNRSVVVGGTTTTISSNSQLHPRTHDVTLGLARYF